MTGLKMKTHEFVLSEDSEQRLDLWLAQRLDLSRSQVKRLIDAELVKVNNSPIKAGYSPRSGDQISVVIPRSSAFSLKPEPIPLEIVYQDQDLAVINKPKNLVVHPGAGNWEGTLVNALLFHFQHLAAGSDRHRPGIVHRLDKDTSGLMIIAKSDQSYRFLAQQLKVHAVQRHYLALVQGVISEEEGLIEKPIGRHPRNRKKMTTLQSGREALTFYSVRQRFKKHTLVLCRLKTGRTHQIRVHFASIHHPVVGDALYGFKTNNIGASSQMLHASYLAFTHPDGKPMEFHSPPPPEFLEAVKKAGQIN